jgi:DNA polymerase-3 subunit gamma/tau
VSALQLRYALHFYSRILKKYIFRSQKALSYQVIARKYRPQTFTDLTGQEHITRTLGNALDTGRLHHAYLFSGVRGTGKTTMARILAKGLNCHRGVSSKPCLACPSCLEIAAGYSLDVLEIDAASNTGVDNVRDVIINNIGMLPARDRYKVFVIDEVHMLSTSAFNALLKTLEEPPSHVVFIMATTELHKVPDTILSRCQQFEFRQIPTEKIYLRLRQIADNENVKISDTALREIARAGAGSLRDAQSAFDQVIAFGGAEITEEDVTFSLGLVSAGTLGDVAEIVAARDTSRMLEMIAEISSRGYDLRNFSRELMSYFRHLLVVKSGITNGEALGVADVEIERLKNIAKQFSEEDLVRCFHLLAETEKAIKDSPHPRFQLEVGMIKLAQATRLRSLEELIARLQSLEAALPGGAPTPADTGAERPVAGPRASTPPSTDPFRKNTAAPTEPKPAVAASPRPATPASPTAAPSALEEPAYFADAPPPSPFEYGEESLDLPPKSGNASADIRPDREIEAMLRELRQNKKPLIAMAIEDAQDRSLRDGTLRVTFGTEDVFAKRIRDSAAVIREIGERLFGRPVRVEVVISGQVEEQVNEAEVKKRELNARAEQNPAVKLILEKTRGEIVSIRAPQASPNAEN